MMATDNTKPCCANCGGINMTYVVGGDFTHGGWQCDKCGRMDYDTAHVGMANLFGNHRYPTRLTEEAQEKEEHIIRLERMRSQKDQWANGKHAHWLEIPADHAKDRDALDAAIEALTGKSRLTEEQVAQLKALVTLGYGWIVKDLDGLPYACASKPKKERDDWRDGGAFINLYPFMPTNCLMDLPDWSDPAPLDIVQALRNAGRLEGEG